MHICTSAEDRSDRDGSCRVVSCHALVLLYVVWHFDDFPSSPARKPQLQPEPDS